jgi:hypothetical protein
MDKLHNNKKLQLFLGFLFGIAFGFFLQKGGVTNYEVIVNQLRLIDFTVLKIMLAAVITTMLLISFVLPTGKIRVQPKGGSIKSSIIGGLLFGIGFGTLGYCPGTVAGAVGSGNIDGLIGGVIGIVIGSGIFASLYTKLKNAKIVTKDRFSEWSFFNEMKHHPLIYTVPFSIILVLFLYYIEKLGL